MVATVVKRDGRREAVSFDQILARVEALRGADLAAVDPVRVAKTVVQGVRDGISTAELDALTVDTAASLSVYHPDYSYLAARVAVSHLHKTTLPSVAAVLPHLADDVRAFAEAHLPAIDAALDFAADFRYDIFGFKTLEKSYLLRDPATDRVVERPQVMLMRNALGIHVGDLASALDTYARTSRGEFTHATPTLFNAGTRSPCMASCFLLTVRDDSIEGLYQTLERCAKISKAAGGVGVSFTHVRGAGSRIASTGGRSAGLLPFLRVYEATARAVDQGGGKRRGAFAVYLEPWHKDLLTFLDLKKNHGAEELRARDLFYALWVPDLFMRRVEADGPWSLFCPSDCPDLVDLYGPAFDERFAAYERDAAVPRRTLPAREVWTAILDAQIETGGPYMLYKDAVNRKSNQANLGTIRGSNLCTEVVQFASADEVAVCTLGSLALPRFVRGEEFDHAGLAQAVRALTRNLNRIVDLNAYPVPEAAASNRRHRPVGLGVQGLSDAYVLLGLPFDSADAAALNREIFETVYHAALSASCELAEADGPYETFAGSPAAAGQLQFDLWRAADGEGAVGGDDVLFSGRWDWAALKARIAAHGLRNSLLVAPMPTASTAQILGNVECFEPPTSNLYVRRVQAGEFALLNRHLVRALEARGLWTEATRAAIVAARGSVQGLPGVPEDVQRLFKTAWEISQRSIIDQAADRGVFVDQSQSLNLFLAAPDHAKLSSMHFYGWRRGLKTGMYYLRTKPAADAVAVTVDVTDPPACDACTA